MVDRIDNSFFNPTEQVSTSDVQQSTGTYKGQEVSVKTDATSLLSDSAEEVTFVASEKVETKLAKRKIQNNKDIKSSATQQAEYFIKKLPDIGNIEKLKEFLLDLKANNFKNRDQVLQEAGKFFKDFSHQFAALSFINEEIKDDEDFAELAGFVQEAISGLLEEHGSEIRATLNIADAVIPAREQGLGDTKELRQFYKDTILDYEDITKTFKDIKEKYPDENLFKSIDFLMTAIGADLTASDSSISKTELQKINDDIFQLRLLGNIHDDCSRLLNKMQKEFRLSFNTDSIGLMSSLLEFKEQKSLLDTTVFRFADTTISGDIEAKIYFLRELKDLAAKIPVKAFDNLEDREKLLTTIQSALDIAINKEEEML